MSTRTSKARPKAKEPTVAPTEQVADTPASVSLDAVVADSRERQRAREDAETAANRTDHDADQEHDQADAETTTADTTEAMTATPDTTEPDTEPPWPPIQEDLAWGLWL